MAFSRPQKAERAIFAVREVVHDLPVYQTRGMASAVDVGGKQCLLTWKGVFNEGDRAPTNHKSVKFHQSLRYKEKNYQLGKSKIGQAGRFSFIPVEGLQSCDALMLIVPGSNVIENDVCAQSFIGGKKLLKFKFQYIKKEQKHVLTSFEGKKCTIEKFAVLGSPIINDKGVIGVVGEDADGQLIPCFITQTELDHKEKDSSESGNSEDLDTEDSADHKEKNSSESGYSEDLDTEDSAGQHNQASHSTDSAAQPSVLQSSEEKHREKDPSEGETGNVLYAPAPAPPSHQPISGTSQEERKELREERHRLPSEHEENDPSEGGTGNVPYAPGGPGETTKDLENVKHVIRESKCESKGVPALNKTDALSGAVSDMGLIVSDNDGKGNCLFHALSEQLETVKKIKISHDELRKTLVQYLKKNRETKDGADLYSMLDENQRTRFGGWDEYLTDMAKDGIWGDEMILFAAANHFKTVIYVISSPPGKERQEIPVRPECKVEDENPIWLGHIYDCHFVSLLKAPVPPSHQPFNGTSQEECEELEEERHKLVSGRHKQAASSTDSVVQSSQSSKEILRSGQFCSKDLPYLALDIQDTERWNEIRTELGVPGGELSGIEDNYERYYMMFKIWLNRNGKRASYEKLAEVLKRVGLSAIRTNYCLEGNHPPSQETEDIHTFENVKQQEIRESDLMKIGNEITNQRWRLGRVLGVKDGELEQIKENHREYSSEQSFRILKRWMEIKGSHATYTALAKALLDRTVALQSILEKFCLEK